jgi:hypothetical protein
MSRTIFGIALGLGLVLACGCGSKPEPTVPNAKLDANPTPPNADPNAPKGDAPAGAAWEIDQSKHAIPATAVKGRIAGVDVTPEVGIEGDELTFRALKAGTPIVERSVRLKLAPMLVAGQPIPKVQDRAWKVNPVPSGGSVTILLQQLKAGDPAAATPLWDEYFARLVALVCARLRAIPRGVPTRRTWCCRRSTASAGPLRRAGSRAWTTATTCGRCCSSSPTARR